MLTSKIIREDLSMRVFFGLAAAIIFGLMTFIMPPHQAGAATADDAFGVWRHPENGSHVQIYKCGGGLCAKVVQVADPSRTDAKNPNPDLRSRPIRGIVIMEGATKSGANTWKGRLYNTQDGQTYNGVITVKSATVLRLEGCVLGGLVCQGVDWSRIK
jgi:uncharacterized protein (DUF2147 family)